jgi:hypothetical protein
MLIVAGGATATTHTNLSTALPAAWRTLLAGLTPSAPPLPQPDAAGDDAPDVPAPPAPTAVTPVRSHVAGRVPAISHPPVFRSRPPASPPARAAAPRPPSSQAQAEAAVKQAEAQLKALKNAQKKSKSSKDSSGSKTSKR